MTVDASNALLRWYDAHKRRLPWRAAGETPDPYRVWLSEIMLQQTTVAAVRPYFEKFVTLWPTVAALADADEAEVMAAWAGLGYYARARNLIACARQVAKLGAFPDDEDGLRALPGIGRYTAAAIAAIAFGRRAVVVDGNVERIVARLFAVEQPLPGARAALYDLAATITPEHRNGDFAQAMMDLGATICTPRNPACGLCPLSDRCAARLRNAQADFPVKAAKAAKPRRQGVAYWLQHEDHVLLVRRPARGMLGGMLALPSAAWADAARETGDADDRAHAIGNAPAAAQWCEAGSVDHVFTHFALTMRLLCARAERRPDRDVGERLSGDGEIWWPAERIGEAGLPSLFAKLAQRGLAWQDGLSGKAA
ncbi:A/G-specific adenine glycosylase [Sphingomonas sp.]|uniref:A/G-specific adenine glycosylase n=1 Tax=Sphingomonas sp. TaxID=28214 RepID=UPI002FC6D839